MKILIKFIVSVSFMVGCISSAWAVPIVYESALNVDSAITDATSGIDFGAGSYEVAVAGIGDHYVSLYLDLEFSTETNTYFNEYGATGGLLAAGQSWEIDEPGNVFGDIRTYYIDQDEYIGNFENNNLDNNNTVDSSLPDDVSMALAWDFTLEADQNATVNFYFTEDGSFLNGYEGFYLTHIDPDSAKQVYFYSALDIQSGGGTAAPVPEPATMLLLGSGLMGLASFRKRIMK